MLKYDFLKSKLQLKSKLRDRSRIKGCSFSYNKKEEKKVDSEILKEFKSKRKVDKFLREKELNTLQKNLIRIRKKIMKIDKKDENQSSIKTNYKNEFSDNLRSLLKRYDRKKVIMHEEYLTNSKNNKTDIIKKSLLADVSNIIHNIKNKSYNLYKAVEDSKIIEKIEEKKDINTFKFYQNFFGFVKNLKKSSSAKNIKSKILYKLNTPKNNKLKDKLNDTSTSITNKTNINNLTKNLNLYYSSIVPKKIINLKKNNKQAHQIRLNLFNKNSDSYFNQNLFLKKSKNITPKKIYNITENNNKTPIKTYTINTGLKTSLNKSINSLKSKINMKRTCVINKPIYTSNYKYFLNNFKKIKAKIKVNKIKRKESHLATFSEIENYSKLREDMLMFKFKVKFINTRFPPKKIKLINKRKLLIQNLEKNFEY